MAYIAHDKLDVVIQAIEDRDPIEGESLDIALKILLEVREAVADDALAEKAREMYADLSDNCIEIDDYAVGISQSDEGVWVNAWVWVPEPDPEEEG